MNAFELRFSMVNLAKSMLEDEYHAKKAHNEEVTWPTLADVLERARKLNDFVSDK
jgi:CRISPR/Cas system endoribonuclease Cas6 (RAMP superfamily)